MIGSRSDAKPNVQQGCPGVRSFRSNSPSCSQFHRRRRRHARQVRLRQEWRQMRGSDRLAREEGCQGRTPGRRGKPDRLRCLVGGIGTPLLRIAEPGFGSLKGGLVSLKSPSSMLRT